MLSFVKLLVETSSGFEIVSWIGAPIVAENGVTARVCADMLIHLR